MFFDLPSDKTCIHPGMTRRLASTSQQERDTAMSAPPARRSKTLSRCSTRSLSAPRRRKARRWQSPQSTYS